MDRFYVAAELSRAKVLHELITMKGAGHGLSQAKREDLGQAQKKIIFFFNRFVKHAK